MNTISIRGALASSVAIVCFSVACPAQAQQRTFDVPAQSAVKAIPEFARQGGIQIVAAGSKLRGKRTNALHGQMDVRLGLRRLIQGTGLRIASDDGATIALTEGNGLIAASAPAPAAERTVQPATSESSTADAAATAPQEEVSEIVVTARKRTERLQDVPQSVSVVRADTLVGGGVTQLRDFANTIPGVNLQTLGAGVGQVSIRGVTAGFDAGSTVATYIDDVPFGSSSAFVDGSQRTLDAALFDLERIEILRGPQGTLYGASSIGGLLKYVTAPPSSDRLALAARGMLSATHHGGLNYNATASLNAPLAEEAALRVAGFYARDRGFVDDALRDLEDVDRSKIYGGRADLLFTPTEALSVRIGGFLQNIERDGEPTVNYNRLTGKPIYGSLSQGRILAEPFGQKFRLLTGKIDYDFGPATLTSITGYQTLRIDAFFDGSEIYTGFCAFQGDVCGAAGVPSDSDTDKFTQEVRLASKPGGRLEWIVGGFYTREKSLRQLAFALFDTELQPIENQLYDLSAPSTYREYAGFGTLTYKFTEKFDVSGGIRVARDHQSYTQNGAGLFIGSLPKNSSSDTVSTYLVNGRYRFSPDAMAYVRLATGYQPGGPNLLPVDPVSGEPIARDHFDPATLSSYELGFKQETRDRRFSVDLSAYFIDWRDMQVQASANGFGYFTNINGGATVRGAEAALTANPVVGLTLTGAFAYQNARTKKAEPLLGAERHERLPNVPRFTATLGADYVIGASAHRPSVGATLRYVSDRDSSFDASAGFPQYHLPDYTQLDLRAGMRLGVLDAQLFIRNALDGRAQLSAATQFGSPRVAVLPPRTVGLSLSSRF